MASAMCGCLKWARRYELRNGEPVETRVLTLGATGLAREKTIHEAAQEFAFADLKGDIDRIGEIAGGFEWMAAAILARAFARHANFCSSAEQMAPRCSTRTTSA